MVYHVKTDITATVNHNKLYSSFQYMLRVSVVLTILRHLKYIIFRTQNKMQIYIF
jgi:hypothetical protein